MVDEERAVLDAGVWDEVEGWDLVTGHDEGGQRVECAGWFWGHVAKKAIGAMGGLCDLGRSMCKSLDGVSCTRRDIR